MKMKQKSTELSIIIYSCWKNRDMWEIFSRLFSKYWSDCPYNIILATDYYADTEKELVFDRVVILDDTWGRMIKAAMKEAATPYVMLWMDDYLLCDCVNTEDVERQINRAKQYHAGNMRLIESPPCCGNYQGSAEVGYYKCGTAYALSTQVGIWDCCFLEKLIEEEWSAWDFERIASLKCKSKNWPILVALDYEFPYEEGVRKGKWMAQGVKLCRRNGIKLDHSKRPIMTNLDMAKIYFQGAILDINPDWIVKVQNFLAARRK